MSAERTTANLVPPDPTWSTAASSWNPTKGHTAAAVGGPQQVPAGGRAVEFYVGICSCGWFASATRRTKVMAEQDAENHVASVRWDNR